MRHVCHILLLVVCAVAKPTVIVQGLGPERNFGIRFIEKGWAVEQKQRLQIRVEAIEDPALIDAIRRGAAKRDIYLLIDRPTEQVLGLANLHLKRLHMRWTTVQVSGLSDGEQLSSSSVMCIGSAYHAWYGPKVWRKELFRKSAELVIESGRFYGQPSPRTARIFMKEFRAAIPVN